MEKSNKKTIKIILTGGGTAGHVWPLWAVYEELKGLSYKYDFQFLYLGSGAPIERISAKKYQVNYKPILSGKFRRYFSFKNLIDPIKIVIGFFQAFFTILSFRPAVIFAKGGYVTVPVVFAAKMLGVPIITHESDVIMGLANRIEAKYASKICVGFPVQFYSDLPFRKLIYTGNPIRKEFGNKAIEQYSNKTKLPVILITGGSQGARFINQTVAGVMGDLTKKYRVIHVAGKNDYEWLKKNKWSNYQLFDFTDKMPEFMATADLIISRAGANTLAEISALGKPSILIPLPSAANNHQIKNAEIYAKRNAAVVLSEKGLTGDNLKDIIERLMEDKGLLANLAQQSKSLSQPDAAEEIAAEIIKVVKNK